MDRCLKFLEWLGPYWLEHLAARICFANLHPEYSWPKISQMAYHNVDDDTGVCRVCRQQIPPEGEVFCPGEPGKPEPAPRGKPPSFLDDCDAIGERLKQIQSERGMVVGEE